jgi:hypothetical protein
MPPKPERDAVVRRLGSLRGRINRHAAAMRGTVGASGMALHQVIGALHEDVEAQRIQAITLLQPLATAGAISYDAISPLKDTSKTPAEHLAQLQSVVKDASSNAALSSEHQQIVQQVSNVAAKQETKLGAMQRLEHFAAGRTHLQNKSLVNLAAAVGSGIAVCAAALFPAVAVPAIGAGVILGGIAAGAEYQERKQAGIKEKQAKDFLMRATAPAKAAAPQRGEVVGPHTEAHHARQTQSKSAEQGIG